MSASYEIQAVIGPGIVSVLRDGDQAIWARSRTRKDHRCDLCTRMVAVSERMFRPIGNQNYRYARLCLHCVVALTEGTTGGGDG